jgi:Fe-S oxidoreductase
MALSDYERDMAGCSRNSYCKFIPWNKARSWRFTNICPSITRFNFHAYSGGGRLNMGLSLVQGRSELSESVAEIIYRCQLCGACDMACKLFKDDFDITDILLEMRAYCVEEGQLIPEHMVVIDNLKKEGNAMGEPKAERGAWAEGLGLKDINTEKADVIFHAGCRYSYDKDLREVIRGAVSLMQLAGADVGIAGKEESCCGGRAYELGFRGEAENYADDMLSRIKASGASTLVTCCSDGYAHLRYLYPRMGKTPPVEVLHITEYLNRMIKEGRLRLNNEVPLLVTYHDPCHLGRMSEPYTGEWKGDKLRRPMSMKRTGRKGCYEPPREVLRSIPGMQLVEMERIKECAWCCGAGGGVMEAYPEFSSWTAGERLEEAKCTGADALVTACPWCERSFKDALSTNGTRLQLYDLTELVLRAVGR